MDNITLNGFEVFEDLMPGASVKNKINTVSTTEEDTKIDIDSASEELSEEELNNIRKTSTKTEDKKEDIEDKTIEEEQETNTKENISKEDETKVSEEEEEDDEFSNEATMITGFFDSLSEKLGWEDVSEEEKPKTVEDLIDYFNDVIEENSTPQYASEEIEQLDKFVKNGGNIRDYLIIDAEVDLDNIDLDEESNQKLVLKEFLKEKGFNNTQIEKKLNKYEDAAFLKMSLKMQQKLLKKLGRIRNNSY